MRTDRHPRHTPIAGWLCLAAAVVAPASAVGATPAERSAQDTLLKRINTVRTNRHLPPLRRSVLLAAPARRHAAWVARTGRLQHEGANGSPFFRRLYRAGFPGRRAVGETIGMMSGCRPRAVARILRMWLASPPHRRLILSSRFHVAGIGVVAARNCAYTAFVADLGA